MRLYLTAAAAFFLLAAPAHAHELKGRWWEGLTLQERLDGQQHLRQHAQTAIRTLEAHELAARRPHLTRPAQREAQHLLRVLRREIPETQEALELQVLMEAQEAAAYADVHTSTSSTSSTSTPAPTGTIDWYAIASCESGGGGPPDWGYSGPGYYDGGLQFDPSTWRSAGGGQYAPYAYQATAAQQIATAQAWVAMVGCYHCRAGWPHCGQYG